MTNYEYDRLIYREGYKYICGVDEAGRGPLAGPVFAAAVILNPSDEIHGLNDSKKLSEQKREALFEIITEKAVAYSVASASVEEIDEINILNATMLAMKRAVDGLKIKPELALIDGNREPENLDVPSQLIIKGDTLSACIGRRPFLPRSAGSPYA